MILVGYVFLWKIVMRKYNFVYRKLIIGFFLAFILSAFSDVLAQSCSTYYTGCQNGPIQYQNCMPCYPGDGGKVRYNFPGWKIGGTSSGCTGGKVKHLMWTCCTCPGPSYYCGDGSCNGGENKCSCPDDCGYPGCGECGNPPCTYCGDGSCNGNESLCANNCPQDCGTYPSCGQCGLPACCTVSGPTAPVLVSPANNTSLTRSSAINLTWSAPSSWGNDCNNGANFYALSTVINGVQTVTYPTTTSSSLSLGVCNSTVYWAVAAYNGAAWSPWSSTYTLTNTGFTGPTISNFSSTANIVSAGTPITFSATANDTDPGADISWMRYMVYNSSNVLVSDSNNLTTPCNGNSNTCATSYTWIPDVNTPQGNYRVQVTSSDQCGYISSVYGYNFSVAPVYNLQVNVDRLGLVIPDSSGNIDFNSVCSSVTGDFSNVNVTYYAGGISRSTLLSNSSGIVTFNNIPQADVNAGITLTATPSSVESCQSYDFYCYGNTAGTMGNQANHRVDFTGVAVGGTKSVNIGLGEEKKDSWETVFDGDIYARNANVGVSCVDATAGGGFETTTIVEDTIGGFFRTAGSLNSSATKDIYTGDNSGYAKDLDGLENNSGNQVNSFDAWFHNYEFPDLTSSTAPVIVGGTLSGIEGNKIYKTNGDLLLTAPITYNLGSSDSVSIVYVNGDLFLGRDLISNNGLVLFIVSGNVTVHPSVGISDYTTAGTFTPTTSANIAAGIISLNDITFTSADSVVGDRTIILNGFVMSKGDLYFNRDLMGNNDRYPAHVIKFDTKILSRLSDLEETLSTGLATYDVQWIYDEN